MVRVVARYHINPETGRPGVCRAKTPDACQFAKDGVVPEHYNSESEARAGYEKQQEHNTVKTFVNTTPFSKYAETLAKVEKSREQYRSLHAENVRLVENFTNLRERAHAGDIDALNKLSQAHERLRLSNLELGRVARNMDLEQHKLYEQGVMEKPEQRGVESPYFYNAFKNQFLTLSKKPVMYSKLTNEQQKNLEANFAAWSGKTREDAQNTLREASKTSDNAVAEALKSDGGKTQKERIYYDLETTGIDPSMGEIIQIGIIRTDANGNVLETINENFDMSNPEYRDKLGTGPVEVHNLHPEDIRGNKKFSDPEVQERIGKILNNPNYVSVAYNNSFEHSWLSTHLQGFWDTHSEDSPESIKNNGPAQQSFDPMTLFQATVSERPNSKMEAFAEHTGIPYENAHNAYADADMMRRAMKNFEKGMQE